MFLKLRFLLVALLAASALVACGPPENAAPARPPGPVQSQAPQSATLTVGSEPRQTFAGFGFSMEQDNPYPTLSDRRKAEVDKLLFEDLHTRILRLWYGPGNPKPLRDFYQASGMIDHALQHGVTELLLAPWTYLGNPDLQAKTIATDIATMRDDYGIKITTTGEDNEPGSGGRAELPVDDYVPLVLAMRRELDARGLQNVKTIGPEFASADDGPRIWFDRVAADPQALAAVDGLATHSYGMAANPELAERVLAHHKQYWMTEAGGPNFNGSAEFAYAFAASVSSRFLNDLNEAVDHWIWFIGLSESTQDVYQKLVMCEGRCANTDRIYKNYSYHHIQQITNAFLPGTVLRHVTSDLPHFPDLVWTYGAKPPLHAAAGVRGDGRWVLAVVNDTQGGSYPPATTFDEPTKYTVTFDVPDLAKVPSLTFDVCRTNTEVAMQCQGTLELKHGKATLDVQSLELITLVAQKPVG
jgi:hypothetical protein